jgi:uncharacterized membrane protein YdbT with pleckstrin-like domain
MSNIVIYALALAYFHMAGLSGNDEAYFWLYVAAAAAVIFDLLEVIEWRRFVKTTGDE